MDINHVYALHHLLSDRRSPLPLNDILHSLEIKKATFHRIKAYMLDCLMAPIRNQKGQGYYYDNQTDQPPYELPGLWFTPQELTALSLLEQLLEASQPAILPKLLLPVKEKMAQLMANQGINQQAYQKRLRIVPQWQRPCDPTTFTLISQALLQRKQLHISYYTRDTNIQSQRTISPQQLVYYRDNWYLDAWCHAKNALRTFAMDQIQTRTAGDKNQTPHQQATDNQAIDIAAEQLEQHYSSSYGIFAGQATDIAALKFSAQIAGWVSREQWHPDQTGEWDHNGAYHLKVPYHNPTELILDILRYGPDVEVLAPRSLRQAVKEKISAALEQYL
ncbi:MAG: WYL domain-containing protein [Pseudomonadales bacterium]|nr:WYL domain-containing protein [Pseudomonadales bacterium]